MKILIRNFQSLGHVELEVDGLTVVVGPSDRGKSAVIRAVEAALFNKGGDQFVRVGHKHASVTLELPDHKIEWVKGSGRNEFTIDGQLHSKVGSKAPDVLQQLGFRDVLIGARQLDDAKQAGGELLRPQIAHQWQGPFLLDRPGTFVNEVVTLLSRLGVLQKAGRQCSLDLRQAKQLLTVRQGDLTQHEQALARLEPVVPLRTRVAGLHAAAELLELVKAKVTRLRALQAQRSGLAAQAAATLPPPAPPVPDVRRFVRLRELAAQRAKVLGLAGRTLPESTTILPRVDVGFNRLGMLQHYQLKRGEADQKLGRALYDLDASASDATAAQAAVQAFQQENPTCPACGRPW